MDMKQAVAITHRITGGTNANWVKAKDTTYPPGTLMCTSCWFNVGDEQPKIRALYERDGWDAHIVVPCPLTRWQRFRRWLGLRVVATGEPRVIPVQVYPSAVFPRNLEYIVFEPVEE